MGLTLTRAQKMSTKLNNRQLMAAEMLGMGYRPSVVAEKLQVARETVSRWQQKPVRGNAATKLHEHSK